nr:MYG1 family protein [Marinomonas rhizomae]
MDRRKNAQTWLRQKDQSQFLLKQYTPWKTTVLRLSQDALFMVYPSQTGQWRIQTVPVELSSFEDRKKLPAPWGRIVRQRTTRRHWVRRRHVLS